MNDRSPSRGSRPPDRDGARRVREAREWDRKHPAHHDLPEGDAEEVEKHLRLRAPVVYQIVREEGEEELIRPAGSLWWSGVTAGVAVSMSAVATSLLHEHLPDAPWRPLVAGFGYAIGFLIVVFGRLQLFTENTITVVLPLMAMPSRRNLRLGARLWAIVLAGNLAGTLLFALAAIHGAIFPEVEIEGFLAVARDFMNRTPPEMAMSGVPAGFLVAIMVWMLPSAMGSEFWVVLVLGWLIGIGGFAHVVVGSSEALLLVLAGELTVGGYFTHFLLPAFIGNVAGGTALFAVLAYSQVRDEL